MRAPRVRFTVWRLMAVISAAAALLAAYKAGQLDRPMPRPRTITVGQRSADGAGDGKTFTFDVSHPEAAAAFRRTVARLKAAKVEHQIR